MEEESDGFEEVVVKNDEIIMGNAKGIRDEEVELDEEEQTESEGENDLEFSDAANFEEAEPDALTMDDQEEEEAEEREEEPEAEAEPDEEVEEVEDSTEDEDQEQEEAQPEDRAQDEEDDVQPPLSAGASRKKHRIDDDSDMATLSQDTKDESLPPSATSTSSASSSGPSSAASPPATIPSSASLSPVGASAKREATDPDLTDDEKSLTAMRETDQHTATRKLCIRLDSSVCFRGLVSIPFTSKRTAGGTGKKRRFELPTDSETEEENSLQSKRKRIPKIVPNSEESYIPSQLMKRLEPTRLTARQKAMLRQEEVPGFKEELVSLPMTAKSDKTLTDEQLQKKHELAARRKAQTDQKLEEEKLSTVHKLLQKKKAKKRGPAAKVAPATVPDAVEKRPDFRATCVLYQSKLVYPSEVASSASSSSSSSYSGAPLIVNTVSFPEGDLGFEFLHQPPRSDPVFVKCARPDCSERKRFSMNVLGSPVPVCSLDCFLLLRQQELPRAPRTSDTAARRIPIAV